MKVLALIVAFLVLAPAGLNAFGGNVPAPFTNFVMGYVNEDTAEPVYPPGQRSLTWMSSTGEPWDAIYRYLVGGPPNTPNGANPASWFAIWPGNGGAVTLQMNDANAAGFMPIFIYEQHHNYSTNAYYPNLGYSGGDGSNGFTNNNNAYNNITWMGDYWQDFAVLVHLVNNWLVANPGKYVMIDIEPDTFGNMQQQFPATDNPDSMPARVASAVPTSANPAALAALTGMSPKYPATLGTLPNTMSGVMKAFLRIREEYAPTTKTRLHLAWHASGWAAARSGAPASYGSPSTSQYTPLDTTGIGNVVGAFFNKGKSSGADRDWDLIFVDPSDADDGMYNAAGEAPGFNHAWDPTGATSPNANVYGNFCDALSTAASKRIMLWQVPIGNSAMPDTNGHWKDDKVEYFLDETLGSARVCAWANKGIIGILWGRGAGLPIGPNWRTGTSVINYFWGNSPQNSWSGGTVDGCTIVHPYVVSKGGSCATLAGDDDGGYLRYAIVNYYNSPCVLPGVGTPTPSFSPSPNFTSTPTPSPTPDCPTLFNGIETLTDNGAWSGTSATRLLSTGTGVTQGTNNLRVDVTAFANWWNVAVANLGGFTPNLWGSYNAISFDIYFDPGNLPWTVGSLSNTIAINGDSASMSKWARDITAAVPVVAGMNNITLPFAWGPGATQLLATDPLSLVGVNLKFEVAKAGRFYIDNIVLHTGVACPAASPTRTPTPTPTNTPSRTNTITPSRTPTGTPTRTVTVSPTASPSVSPTSTGSPTRSATQTITPSATPSATRTATASATGTVSPSATRTSTVSPSASPTTTLTHTASPLASSTNSPSISPTSTQSAVFTLTVTPSSSVTPTGTVTASASNTVSPSPTRTVTVSATPTATGTSSVSPTPTVSASITPTNTISIFSPTNTPVQSATATITATRSATVTPSVSSSATPSVTLTRSPTSSATPTFTFNPNSPTNTPLVSATPSVTLTATGSASATVSPSSTMTMTASLSPSPTLSSSASPTPLPGSSATFTASPTATMTAGPLPPTPANTATADSDGPNLIDKHVAAPNPNPAAILAHLLGKADKVELRVYTKALVCIGVQTLGPQLAGWCSIPLPPDMAGQAAGMYSYSLKSFRGSLPGVQHVVGSFLIMR